MITKPNTQGKKRTKGSEILNVVMAVYCLTEELLKMELDNVLSEVLVQSLLFSPLYKAVINNNNNVIIVITKLLSIRYLTGHIDFIPYKNYNIYT
ncbi:hypothetical protein Glove_48g52 [Diversispora epigaea]|uniref:Uncharacterized protein n=1 Tax=Diversispora epigaea TaxID=1348612 RepID=A0A397JIL9_9GLOM|nr:hypothetical protein Glove_48g52 [Diversispora epigaea]